MRYYVPFILLPMLLAACSEKPDPISVQVYPAVLAGDASPEMAGWDTVTFAGSQRSPAGAYLVAPEPLFTEWNIIAFHSASQADGSAAITALLNAYAAQKLDRFSSDPVNLKKPLAIRINGRWADFLPLLSRVEKRITLYGFTSEEADQLQHYLDSK